MNASLELEQSEPNREDRIYSSIQNRLGRLVNAVSDLEKKNNPRLEKQMGKVEATFKKLLASYRPSVVEALLLTK